MQTKYLTTPVPHNAAAKLIKDKAPVAREIFDQLPDEIRAKAFMITGIEDFDTLEKVRDEIASIPMGGDWDEAKKGIIRRISPYLDEDEAGRRAELLLRFHAFDAYQATETRIMDSMTDVFPYRQWLTTGDDKVRASHRALHEIILPADHPLFRRRDFGCRCQSVEMTAEERDEEMAKDAKRPEARRRVLDDSAAQVLKSSNIIAREPGKVYDLGPSLGDRRNSLMTWDEIRQRWGPETTASFESWATHQLITVGASLLDFLLGRVVNMFRA
jgi:hypothetical protein